MAGSKTSLQQLQRRLQRRHLRVKQRHYWAVEAQPGTLARLAFGAGCEAGTGAVWGFASGAAESADRSRAGGGQTDGGVNSGAPEPVVSAAQRTGGWRGSLRMCTVRARPQAKWQRWREPGRSEAPPETNLLELPV